MSMARGVCREGRFLSLPKDGKGVRLQRTVPTLGSPFLFEYVHKGGMVSGIGCVQRWSVVSCKEKAISLKLFQH
jgi:hypothetical protein